jgi:hypothetical protein
MPADAADAWPLWCGGPLLEAVQGARLFDDCKDFV